MPDPAIEAAKRALTKNFDLVDSGMKPYLPVINAAAREALKPVRSVHARWENLYGGCRGEVPEMVQVLLEELAPLIYATEELK